jgi:hypothetical protein
VLSTLVGMRLCSGGIDWRCGVRMGGKCRESGSV